MSRPVVHFEIIGQNPERLRDYYRELFGWDADTSAEVAPAVSDPHDYGFIERSSLPDGTGIPGGVGGGPDHASRAMFYVGVPDVESALREAERLGGTHVMGPVVAPGSGVISGHFRDPQGNLVGVAGPLLTDEPRPAGR